ncbi:MAG TPA: hypothetical protein VFO85_21550, partial [Vicinamibacteria bacterium]|nr:hypothetical protein [Vicinamibacteria bacterium]
MRRAVAAGAAPAVVFALAFAVLAGPSVPWPMTFDDLHLVRPFAAHEIRSAFTGNWDPDDMEVRGYRPLAVLFNHLRSLALGEAVWAHRTFLLALYTLFLAGLAVVARALGASAGEAVAGGLLALASRYSVYHYAFLTDGLHLVQGLLFLAALAALWAWMRTGAAAALGGSLAALAAGLLCREDTLAAVPPLWLLAWARHGRRPRAWRRLAAHAAASSVLAAALLALRAQLIPVAPQPALNVAGWWDYVVRAFSLGGAESFDRFSRWAVASWRWAPLLLAGALALARAPARRRALVFAACAAAACAPALTLRRENLLFFPVAFAAMAYAAALAGAAARLADLGRGRALAWAPLALGAWLALGAGYVAREFLRVFHPMSSTSLTWSGAFVYGYYGEARV